MLLAPVLAPQLARPALAPLHAHAAQRCSSVSLRIFDDDDLGELLESDRWVLWTMPVVFFSLWWFLTLFKPLFPNLWPGWLIFFGLLAAGGTWELPNGDSDDDYRPPWA